MKKAIASVLVLVVGCAAASKLADSPAAQDVLDARDAICKIIEHTRDADPQLRTMCAGDASLKKIAAKYASDECTNASAPELTAPAVSTGL